MAKSVVDKRPGEKFSPGLDFTGELPPGTTIASGTVVCLDSEGEDVSSAFLAISTATIDAPNNIAKIRLKKVTDGSQPPGMYKLQFTLVLSNADELIDYLPLLVLS